MIERINVTVVDDDEDDFILTEDYLSDIESITINCKWASTIEEAEKELANNDTDLYLIDYRLGKKSGLDLLDTARKANSSKPIIILTGQGDREIDMLAMKMGADDYLVKSELTAEKLERSVRYAMERYIAKEKINQREAKYKNLFHRSIDPIYIIDKTLSFTEVNESMCALFGYEPNELESKPLSQLFLKPKTFERFSEALLNKGLIKDFEATLIRNDGKKLICSITTIVLFDLEHEIEGYQGIIRDNTKQKENEQQLLRAEKLGMTGRLARSIAHEVRNPLTNINLSLEQMTAEMKEDSDEMMYSGIIKRNSDRINNLITELLNSAKPTKVNLTPTVLDEFVPKALELAHDRIKLKSVKLHQRYGAEGLKANIDPNQLKTALLNIFINAIEAMENKAGILTIETKVENRQLWIEISDNGEGIDTDKLNNLFDAFYTGKRTGMGLGLTTTQNIINAHKATIAVESELGIGTKFTIKLNQV
jgi:PAS domain S-box-containing protein